MFVIIFILHSCLVLKKIFLTCKLFQMLPRTKANFQDELQPFIGNSEAQDGTNVYREPLIYHHNQ